MRTLKLPLWEDEYDAMIANHATSVTIPGTSLWMRRLSGPAETHPTEVIYYRGLFGSDRPRRFIAAQVTGVTFDPAPATGAAFGVFHIKHAALDAANEKTEETQ